jgi:hypothetical protein
MLCQYIAPLHLKRFTIFHPGYHPDPGLKKETISHHQEIVCNN